MGVDLDYLLDGGGLHERAGDPLLDGQDDALGGLDADGRGAQLDRLDGVLDLGGGGSLGFRESREVYLEEPALRGEGVRSAVVLGSVQEHVGESRVGGGWMKKGR